jgi:ubiquinone/menaquinone biosynthesis C-methylase UbiE
MSEYRSRYQHANPPENYERFFVPAIGQPLAKELVREAELRPGERVLDVACGTGVVTRLALDAVGSNGGVAGLDPNPGMLAVARTTVPPDVPIEWHEAGAESMPLSDQSFDAVLCQMGLQFIPDKPLALKEMRRVLAPGGRVLLNAPGPKVAIFDALSEAMGRHIGPQAAGFVDQVFSLDDTAELEGLLSDAGFTEVNVDATTEELRLPAPKDFLWQYLYATPLVGLISGVDDQVLDALEQDVVAGWREFEHDGGMRYGQRMLIGRGRR